MRFEFVDEFRLDESAKAQVNRLLTVCFPETDYGGRTYFKQLPHYRLLLWEDDGLIGQLGLDYRVMTLGGAPARVLGVIDLAIRPTHQRRGLGTKMLAELDAVAERFHHNIDFLFLVADKHGIYERSGYKPTKRRVRWLTVEDHVNYGIQEGWFDDCLMYKQVGALEWKDGDLDLLGYWY